MNKSENENEEFMKCCLVEKRLMEKLSVTLKA